MFSLLPLRVLYFLCYVKVFLNSKLERISPPQKKESRRFFKAYCVRWTNVLLFDVLTILIHHFVLFFNILSQKKKKIISKGKAIFSQAA